VASIHGITCHPPSREEFSAASQRTFHRAARDGRAFSAAASTIPIRIFLRNLTFLSRFHITPPSCLSLGEAPSSRHNDKRFTERSANGEESMRKLIPVLICAALLPMSAAWAQLLAPNAASVSMGHLNYVVRNMPANRKFWIGMGATPVMMGTQEVLRFPE